MASKDLILTKMEAPTRQDFLSDALAVRKRRLKTLIIIGLLALLAAAWLVPVFPERLPDGIWQEDDFELVRPTLEKAIEKLRFNDGYDFSRYTLIVPTGFTTMRRSLLGNRSGSAGTSGAGYNYVVPEGLSFLNYDHTARMAKLLPEHYEEFMVWCEAEILKRSLNVEGENKKNKPEMTMPRKPSD